MLRNPTAEGGRSRPQSAGAIVLLAGLFVLPLAGAWVYFSLNKRDWRSERIREVITRPQLANEKTISWAPPEPVSLVPTASGQLASGTAELLAEAQRLMSSTGEIDFAAVEGWHDRLGPELATLLRQPQFNIDCDWFEGAGEQALGLLGLLVNRQLEQPARARESFLSYTRLAAVRRSCPLSNIVLRGYAARMSEVLSSRALDETLMQNAADILGLTTRWFLEEEVVAYQQLSAREWDAYLNDGLFTAIRKRGYAEGVYAWMLGSPPGRRFLDEEITRTFWAADKLQVLARRPFWEVEEEVAELQDAIYWAFILPEALSTQVELDLSRIALVLARYRVAHGTYPPSLEALPAQQIALDLTDPFSGAAYRYQLVEDGFVLGSVGPRTPRMEWIEEEPVLTLTARGHEVLVGDGGTGLEATNRP